jgi:hypothetical protein
MNASTQAWKASSAVWRGLTSNMTPTLSCHAEIAALAGRPEVSRTELGSDVGALIAQHRLGRASRAIMVQSRDEDLLVREICSNASCHK